MLDQLIKVIAEKGWDYKVLNNDLCQKEAVYFILGELKEEVILFKHEEGIIEDYINLIKEWEQ